MCHISYKETKAGSIRRKPGTAGERRKEGRRKRLREKEGEKERESSHVNIKLFFHWGQWGRNSQSVTHWKQHMAQRGNLVTAKTSVTKTKHPIFFLFFKFTFTLVLLSTV